MQALKDQGLLGAERNGHSSRDMPPIQQKVVAQFPYYADGELVLVVERLEPGGDGRTKEFRLKHPAPDGQGFHFGLGGKGSRCGCPRIEPPLYRQYELQAAPLDQHEFVVEGEGKVDALMKLGIVATSALGGAGRKWEPRYSDLLEGREVIILPDNDDSGQKHATDVAGRSLGKASVVKVLDLPGLPAKGAIIDWLAAGHTGDELTELADKCPAWEPASTSAVSSSAIKLTRLSDLLAEPPEQVSWTWDKTLPAGGLSIMAAKPKVGKSTLARNLALAVAQGNEFLGRETSQGPVVYLALEEKRSEVQAHFSRMGGTDEDIYVHVGVVPDHALEELEKVINQVKPVFVVIDPMLRFVRVRDANDYAEVTRALEPVLALARISGCHIMLVHHAGKMDREGGDSILGSTAFFGGVDTAMVMRRKEAGRTLETTQCYGEDFPETVIGYNTETGSVSAGGTVSDVEEKKAREGIFKALGEGSMTRPQLLEAVEGKTKYIVGAIYNMAGDGELSRSGMGKKNDPIVYPVSKAESPDKIGVLDDVKNGCSLVPAIYKEQREQQKQPFPEHEVDSVPSIATNVDGRIGEQPNREREQPIVESEAMEF